MGVLVVVVVAALLVLFVVAPSLGSAPLGNPLGLGHPPGPTTNGMSFAQARAMADPYAQGDQGGGWMLYEAIAISSPQAYREGGQGICSTMWVPAMIGSTTGGLAPDWAFFYEKLVAPNSYASLAVVVENGSAASLSTCTSIPVGSLGAIPTGIMDSTQAASDGMAAGAAQTFKSYPNASVELGVIRFTQSYGGGFAAGTYWAMLVGVCLTSSPGEPRGTYPEFEVIFNATTGAIALSQSLSQTCGGYVAPSIGSMTYDVAGDGSTTISQPDYPSCNTAVGGDSACFTTRPDGSCSFAVNAHANVALKVSVSDKNGYPLSGATVTLAGQTVMVSGLPGDVLITGQSAGGGSGDVIWTSVTGTVPANDAAGGLLVVSATYSSGGTTTQGSGQIPVEPPSSANC
ncbi:MAG: hypothetical protein KGI89_08725 [Euryarchaeota archaeon]|nr:hypothetical protein [Euryarchaeota archaeon]